MKKLYVCRSYQGRVRGFGMLSILIFNLIIARKCLLEMHYKIFLNLITHTQTDCQTHLNIGWDCKKLKIKDMIFK